MLRTLSRERSACDSCPQRRCASDWRPQSAKLPRQARLGPAFSPHETRASPCLPGRLRSATERSHTPGSPVWLFPCFSRPLSGYLMKRRRSDWRFRYGGRIWRGRDDLDRCASPNVGRNGIEESEQRRLYVLSISPMSGFSGSEMCRSPPLSAETVSFSHSVTCSQLIFLRSSAKIPCEFISQLLSCELSHFLSW